MDTEKRAAEVLRQTEHNLRELVSAAAHAGDYASVIRIAAWAKAVGDMVKGIPATAARPSSGCGMPVVMKHQTHGATVPEKPVRPRPRETLDYPRFFRQGDHLVRISWSKREKKEYRHKARCAVLHAVVHAMANFGKDGRIFSTEEFLPIIDSDGTEAPLYQAYVVIALLKHTSLIDQHGRQGYSIPRLAEFKETVEAVWQKLPNK